MADKTTNPAFWYSFKCPVCGKSFERLATLIKSNWARGHSGPFCSRKCSAREVMDKRFKKKSFGKTKIIKRFKKLRKEHKNKKRKEIKITRVNLIDSLYEVSKILENSLCLFFSIPERNFPYRETKDEREDIAKTIELIKPLVCSLENTTDNLKVTVENLKRKNKTST